MAKQGFELRQSNSRPFSTYTVLSFSMSICSQSRTSPLPSCSAWDPESRISLVHFLEKLNSWFPARSDFQEQALGFAGLEGPGDLTAPYTGKPILLSASSLIFIFQGTAFPYPLPLEYLRGKSIILIISNGMLEPDHWDYCINLFPIPHLVTVCW